MIHPTSSVGYGVNFICRRTYSLGRSSSARTRSSCFTNASKALSICRIQLGTQIAPCSTTPTFSSGKRSNTPSNTIVASVCIGGNGIAM